MKIIEGNVYQLTRVTKLDTQFGFNIGDYIISIDTYGSNISCACVKLGTTTPIVFFVPNQVKLIGKAEPFKALLDI